MSTETQITRLMAARNKIRLRMVTLGLALDTDNLTQLADKLDTVANRGTINATVVEGDSYTIEPGYYAGGTVSGIQGGGEYGLQSKTNIIPTKEKQTITSDSGYYGLSSVEVMPIPAVYQDVSSVNADEASVLSPKKFVTADGVLHTGSMADIGKVTETLSTAKTSYTVPTGYHHPDAGGNAGTVSIVLETKSVDPTREAQDVTPTAGKVLSKVTVSAIPDELQDVSGVTATKASVLASAKFVDSEGTLDNGSIPTNTTITKTLDTTTGNTSVSIPSGYYATAGNVKVVTETKNVTLSREAQTIKPSAGKVLSSVSVPAIDSKLQDVSGVTATADTVLDTAKFVDSDGTLTDGTIPTQDTISTVLDVRTGHQSVSIPSGYYAADGSVSLVTETKTAAANSRTKQTITPTAGKVLASVEVPAMDSKYQDVSGVTATAATVLNTAKFVDSTGALTSGTMANNGATGSTIDGLSVTSYTIPAGYTTGGTVSLDDTIETELAKI